MFETKGSSIPIFADGTGWISVYWKDTKKTFCQCRFMLDNATSKDLAQQRAELLVKLLNQQTDSLDHLQPVLKNF